MSLSGLSLLLAVFCAAQTITPATVSVPLVLPSTVTLGASGNLYIADTENHIVRRLDTTGQVTTVAGDGVQGFSGDGGPATSAQLDSPQGLAADSSNNLYIADTHNHRIRKLNLGTGTVVTIAGTGAPGISGDGGLAVAAQLDHPTALTLDVSGNLYIADTENHRIRRIDATTGIISTVVGAGTQGFSADNLSAAQSIFDSPSGIAVDATGNLYVADTHNHRIRRVDAVTGLVTTIAGTGTQGFSGDNAASASAMLALPHGISIDAAGNLYLADTENHRIRRIDAATGAITTVAGNGIQGFSGDGAAATAATIDSPRSALSPAGALIFTDTSNNRVRSVQSANIATVAGPQAASPVVLSLSVPSSVPYGSGQISAKLTANTPASGTITFYDSLGGATATLGTATLTAGAANLSISMLSAGQYTLTASYSGDQSHPAAQSLPVTLTITQAPTSTTLTDLIATASSGSSVTLTAQVAAALSGAPPTGTVTLLDGTLPVATNALSNGLTAFTLSGLSLGQHTLTAAYNGSADFSASISNAQQVTIGTGAAADFTLAATGSVTQTVLPGTAASFTFAVQPSAALSSPVTLAASGQPAFSTVSFSPTYIPPGSSQNTVTVTITTPGDAQISMLDHLPRRGSRAIWALLVVPLTLTVRVRRGRWASLAVLALVCFTGCGDRVNSAGGGTASVSKSFAITVTGTATSPSGVPLTHSATVTLVLQSAS